MFELRKSLTFEAAHRLPGMPAGHKCARLHGHSFKATLVVRGDVNPETGVVIDYAVIKELAKPIIDGLDHQYLNEIEGLANPSSEVLAKWIYDRLANKIPGLWQVIVAETCTSECLYPAR